MKRFLLIFVCFWFVPLIDNLTKLMKSYTYQIAVLIDAPAELLSGGSRLVMTTFCFTFCLGGFKNPKSFFQTLVSRAARSSLTSVILHPAASWRGLKWVCGCCQVWNWLPHQVWAVWPWARYSVLLGCCFLLCKMGLLGGIKWDKMGKTLSTGLITEQAIHN